MICPECKLPMSIIGIGGDENNGMTFLCDGPNDMTAHEGCNADVPVTDILEGIREAIRAENVSYGELYDLQCLAEHIDPSDVELLEWAGVPEFPEFEAADQPLWENDEAQFARLIAEMEACGAFIGLDNWHSLFESTDMTADDVREIIDRAQASYEKTCAGLTGLGGRGTM